MISTPLFPVPEGLEITDVTEIDNVVHVHLISHRLISMCPTCSTPSSHIHSHYRRHPRDLPCSGRAIHLVLTVKKFFCRQAACVQNIFVERLPDILAVSSRLTNRLRTAIQEIGFSSTGKGGEILSVKLGMGVSDATILRSLFLRPPPTPPYHLDVIGIDDWSYRRGRRFGSIIIDLLTHTVVDLLPERSTESVIRWLLEHPEVRIISRDRGAVYVDGATQGAPSALQVCDRWHLLANLGEAVEAYLVRSPVRLPTTTPVHPTIERPLTAYSATPAQQRRTYARLLRKGYLAQHVHTLHAQGKSDRAISRELGVARGTVSKYLRQPPEIPPPTPRPYRFSMLDAYDDMILDHLRRGCRNAAEIHRAMMAQGFTGGPTNVRAYVKYLCTSSPEGAPPVTRTQRTKALSPRALRWLLTRTYDELTQDEQAYVDAVVQMSPEIQQVYTLLQSFQTMVRERQSHRLQAWMDEAKHSGIGEFKRFVTGLERDRDAVSHALSLPWSQGPVEGKVNKLKTLKRMMYGRAGFPLLRLRLLYAA